MPLVLAHILVALGFTLVLILIFIAMFKEQTAAEGLLFFALLVFLATWAGGMWMSPFGPIWYGVSWMPFLVMGIFTAMLMVIAIPEPRRNKPRSSQEREKETTQALGILAICIVLMLVVGIVAGYIPSPPATA